MAKKLGYQAGIQVLVEGAPQQYRAALHPLPDGVRFVKKLDPEVALIHLFLKSAAQLEARLRALRSEIREDASVWVSWPKKASKVSTDITEDVIRGLAAAGLRRREGMRGR